jgi:hypothetical protein
MPPKSKIISDDELVCLITEVGITEAARRTGLGVRGINARRVRIEKRTGHDIISSRRSGPLTRHGINHPGRINRNLYDGVCLVGGDCHYWPGPASLMHRAFVHFCKKLKPGMVVLDGDVVDLGQISRYPPIGWERLPTVQEEIETAQERTGEIETAAFKAEKLWPLGNHDGRFETRLATVAPEFAKLHGVHLSDHFPLWAPCWSVFINDNVVIKHRFKGGLHAAHNNTLWAGRTVITGHLHSQRISPLTDYNGDRWGVDIGCIADPAHRAFIDYTEDSPKNWRDGFCVLTFWHGRLLPPELVSRWDEDHVVFRGEIIKV